MKAIKLFDINATFLSTHWRISSWLFLGLVIILHILQQALHMPSGYGIEDFLAFNNKGAIEAVHTHWKSVHHWIAIAYLAIDLALFIPVYSIFFIRLAYWFGEQFQHSNNLKNIVFWGLTGITASLVTVDILENTSGLLKLTQNDSIWVLLLFVLLPLIICFAALAYVIKIRTIAPEHLLRLLIITAATLFLVLIAAYFFQDFSQCKGDGNWYIGCYAHLLKLPSSLLLITLFILGLNFWLFGFLADGQRKDDLADLRAAIVDIMFRSRYVLIALILAGGLMIGIDQSRDVLVGMVDATFNNGKSYLYGILTFLISLVALWTFSHSCWLWTRVICKIPSPSYGQEVVPRVFNKSVVPGSSNAHNYIESFCRYWARFTGLAPLLIFAELAAQTLGDLVASNDNTTEVLAFLLVAGSALLTGTLFIISRDKIGKKAAKKETEGERYYNDTNVLTDKNGHQELRPLSSWSGPRYTFWIFFPHALVWLPIVSLLAMVVARIPVGMENWPPLALPIVMFALSAWLGFFGWLSILEQRKAQPWVLALIIVIGVLGTTGLTQNHRVWAAPMISTEDGYWVMLLSMGGLAFILAGLGYWLVTQSYKHKTHTQLLIPLLFIGIAGLLLVFGADKYNPRRLDTAKNSSTYKHTQETHLEKRNKNTLDQALAKRIRYLYNNRKTENTDAKLYFIATEGGGARAAYWTALALYELAFKRSDIQIEQIFMVSGVSGGSVGATQFLTCYRKHTGDADKVKKCMDNLARTDLISPLLGSWLFEDLLAAVLPVAKLCDTPGCGILSRGIWFEHAMERVEPEMRNGFLASFQSYHDKNKDTPLPPLPYLFLNSTWVETGERAISSEIKIDYKNFPTARDIQCLMNQDIPLSSAAHNSARFPFINAMGAITSPKQRCFDKDKQDPIVGHVADGGYFDNSGTHTVIDVLEGLKHCLRQDQAKQAGHACTELVAPGILAWAKAKLQPELILIHNDAGEDCDSPKEWQQPTGEHVRCRTTKLSVWQPEKPTNKGHLNLYSGMLGPIVTVLNVSGLGSNRNRADALVLNKMYELRNWLNISRIKMGKPVIDDEACYRPEIIAQIDDGKLYPLGWYLSRYAMNGMQEQIARHDPSHGNKCP